MTTRIEVHRQVAIAGRVTLTPSGEPAAGALVAITSAPAAYEEWLGWRAAQYGGSLDGVAARPDQVHAAADGYYHFLDLPAGHYGLTASVPGGGSRYATGTAEADVTIGAGGDVTLAHADLAVPATTLSGIVTRGAGGPVHMAAVRVAGSGEATFSSADGTFSLHALEAGRHTLTVSGAGYEPVSVAVTLQPGAETHVDVALADASP